MSSALKRMTFLGTLVPRTNFLQNVESTYITNNLARRATVYRHSHGPHTTEQEIIHVGDEHGLQGRFQQAIGQEFGAALEATAINLYFADFKSSGVEYVNTPDVVGLQTVGDDTAIKLVWELKVP
ncbi:unnamed protein product [Penicillium salamii]|nr:unnamed protein product [Penicillium salamii]